MTKSELIEALKNVPNSATIIIETEVHQEALSTSFEVKSEDDGTFTTQFFISTEEK